MMSLTAVACKPGKVASHLQQMHQTDVAGNIHLALNGEEMTVAMFLFTEHIGMNPSGAMQGQTPQP